MDKICFYLIVPVYKAEKYLRECFDSVLGQTYQNFRIVAVDDGSPDSSGEICEEYARRDSRIAVLHQTNQGQLAARQNAVRFARRSAGVNDYFVFLDSDDKLEPNALQTAQKIISRELCDMLVWGYQSFDGDAVIYRSAEFQPFSGVVTEYPALLRRVFCEGYGSICRKVTAARLFDDSFTEVWHHVRIGEDQLQFLKIYPQCKKTVFISDAMYDYRINRESVTQHPTPQAYAAGSAFLSACQDFLEKENVWSEEDWAAFRASQLEQVTMDLSAISRMDAPRKDKLEVLKKYLADPFFRGIIDRAPAKPGFLLLAKWHMPGVMILIGTWMHGLGEIKRKLKKIRQ